MIQFQSLLQAVTFATCIRQCHGNGVTHRFEADLVRRRARNALAPALDERLLAALPKLPDCAGVALGVDRLLMALLGTEKISDVLAFPFDRA